MSLRPLITAIGAWTPGTEVSEDPLFAILAAWAAIVGPEVARNSRPHSISRGALVILTRSSAWSQQLSFLSEQILGAIASRRPGAGVERLAFRVGRILERPTRAVRPQSGLRPTARARRGPSASLEEAFERFRRDVLAIGDAKRSAGWKKCRQCEAWFSRVQTSVCAPCESALATRRSQAVSRAMFEVPWLGYAGIAEIVAGLSRDEYEAIRKRTLQRWWELLLRARRAGKLSARRTERLFASSYVLLKSELAPDQITSATVRNLLGDELHDLLYEREKS